MQSGDPTPTYRFEEDVTARITTDVDNRFICDNFSAPSLPVENFNSITRTHQAVSMMIYIYSNLNLPVTVSSICNDIVTPFHSGAQLFARRGTACHCLP